MATEVGGNHVHTLSKEAQLVEPLRSIATKAMHEEESLCGPLRMDIDHADAPETLGTASSRHIDGAAVEFDIECHKVPPLGKLTVIFCAAACGSQAKKTENTFSS